MNEQSKPSVTPKPPLPHIQGRRLFAGTSQQQAQDRSDGHIKRVFGTVSPREYARWKSIADQHGRTVWNQIYTCACAYLSKQTVVRSDVLDMQNTLAADLRRIGNNLNQAVKLGHIKARNDGRLYAEPNDQVGQAVLSAFKSLEQRVCQFEADITLNTSPNSSDMSP